MHRSRSLAFLAAAMLLVGCGEAEVQDPGPPGGHFTIADADGSHVYSATAAGIDCAVDEALNGTPVLRVSFHSLEQDPGATLYFIAGPYSAEAESSTYDGALYPSPEMQFCSNSCWGVWWRPSEGKEHVSTLVTQDCLLETTAHEGGVAGDFACAQLEPGTLAIQDGHFYCPLPESSP